MAKYDPLGAFVRRQRKPTLEMSFRDIETVINGLLPKASAHAAWWAKPASGETPGVQQAAWRAAGYEAKLLVGERVRFTQQP